MRAKRFGQIGPALAAFCGPERGICVGLRMTAKPRVNFIKSPYDDDFKAETCPADTEACRKKSDLVTGDLALTGETLARSPASPTT